MNTLTTIMISFIANLDNIPIGIANKLTKKDSLKISIISTIIIAIIDYLFCLFCQNIKFYYINEISSLFLIIIGLKCLFKRNSTIKKYNNILLISTALILNNITLSLTLCSSLKYVVIFCISNFISSVILFNIPNYIKLNYKYEKIVEILASLFLILFGIIRLIIN